MADARDKIIAEQSRIIAEQNKIIAKQNRVIAELKVEIKALKKEVVELRAEVARLKGEDPDPATPPGMIPTYKKPEKRRRGKKPGRKRGHKGSRRAKPEKADGTKHHVAIRCPHCGTKLKECCRKRTRYIEDIPSSASQVTENVIHGGYCPVCDKIVEPVVTDALPRATLGIHLVVLTAWMKYGLGLTVGKIVKWLSTMCKVEVTAGGLIQAWYSLTERVLPLYDEIGKEAKESAVLHADETGWRVGGSSWWLWCFTTKTLAYYVIDRCRGSPVVQKVLGDIFNGVLIVDFFAAYNRIVAMAKQRCIVHLFRELEKVSKYNRNREWRRFCKKVKRLFRDASRFCKLGDARYAKKNEKRFLRFYARLRCLYEADYKDKDCRRIRRGSGDTRKNCSRSWNCRMWIQTTTTANEKSDRRLCVARTPTATAPSGERKCKRF